jgi:hypothetical protein
MPVLDKIKGLSAKIDQKALAGAVGLMLLSWGALPLVYRILMQRNAEKKQITRNGRDACQK